MTSSAFLHIIRENKLVEEDKLQACLRTLSPNVLTGEDALAVAEFLNETIHRPVLVISAVTGKGLPQLIQETVKLLDALDEPK